MRKEGLKKEKINVDRKTRQEGNRSRNIKEKSLPGQTIIIIIQNSMATFDKTRWLHKKKQNIHPPKRWGHTAALLQEGMYIFGGKLSNEGRKVAQPIYRLNCESFEFEKLTIENPPANRDSHSAFFINRSMWVWGGCIKEEVGNDCYEFRGNYWQQIMQFGQVPPPRQSQLAILLDQRWVFMMGGCSDSVKYEDCYLFDSLSSKWCKIENFKGKLPYRQNATLCLIRGCMYLFGGLDINQRFTNDVFRMRLSNLDFNDSPNPPTLHIESVNAKGASPLCRASHAGVVYRDRYMIVLGGETNQKNPKQQCEELLNDIWVLDVENETWGEIKPKNPLVFKPNENFTASLYKDSIIIFGGIKELEKFQSTDDLLVLELVDSEELILEKKINSVCTICRMIYRQKPIERSISSPLRTKNMNIDMNSVYRMAQQILQHPFDAIRILLANFNKLQGSVNLELNNGVLSLTCNNDLQLDRNLCYQYMYSWNHATEVTLPVDRNMYLQQHELRRTLLVEYQQLFRSLIMGSMRLGQNCLAVLPLQNNHRLLMLVNRDRVYSYTQDSQNNLLEKDLQYNEYLIVKRIAEQKVNLNGLNNCQIIIFDLNMSPFSSRGQLENVESDVQYSYPKSLKCKKPKELYSLSEYLRLCRFEHLQLSIRNSIIKYESWTEQPHRQSVELQLPDNIRCGIYYEDKKEQNVIGIYSSKELVYIWQPTKANFSGFVQLPTQYHLNLMRTNIENRLIKETLEYELDRQLSLSFNGLKGKRNNGVPLNTLWNETLNE